MAQAPNELGKNSLPTPHPPQAVPLPPLGKANISAIKCETKRVSTTFYARRRVVETSTPTKQNSEIARFVSTFKRFCHKEIGTVIFQRSFHDHVIRDENDYNKIADYIASNPLNWEKDCFFNEGDKGEK